MGDLIPYEVFLAKQRERKYGTAASRFGGLPRLSPDAITAISTPEVDAYSMEDEGEEQ
jgi:hypothetical protein